MTTVAELQSWKPGSLGTLADTLSQKRKKLVDLQDEIDGAEPPPTWVAGSASKARTTHEKLRLRLLDLAAEVADVTVNLDDAQARIKVAQDSLEDALGAARAKGFTVDRSTGTVKDPQVYDDPLLRNAAMKDVQAIADDIDAALMAAQEADLDLKSALVSAEQGKVDGGTGTLDGAVNSQLPTRMDGMSDEELAALLGDEVTIHTISAYIELEAELASFEFEGAASADYKVMADGTVVMALHLEAGLGREISVGKAEADVSAGGTTDLELKFDSPEEAQRFLEQLDEEALSDIGVGDVINGSAPADVAANVARYVMEQDVKSFKTGVYAAGEMEFDTPWAEGEIKGRGEAYYDWATDEVGLKLEASGDVSVGGKDSGYDAAAKLGGEIVYGKDGTFHEFKLSGKLDAVVANEKLGVAMPANTGTGTGFDVELKIDDKNPAVDDIKAAISAGEFDRAKDIALDNGQLVMRQTVIEDYGTAEHEYDIKVAKLEVEAGARGETATQVWFREAGHREVVNVPVSKLPANSGG